MQTKILLVEDDDRIAAPVREDLENQSYFVDRAADGETGLQLASQTAYDLILLDLMLPKIDGFSLCEKLRSTGYKGAILMLTGRNSKYDKIQGLDSGADDYLVKPFDIDELAARVRALLRRNSDDRKPLLSCGALIIDTAACSISYDGQPVALTPTEYRLLVLFLRHPGRTFSKDELLEKLWSIGENPVADVIKAHMKGLRGKLAAAGAPREIIETVYGMGYRLSTSQTIKR
ncbi:MAG: response regulator transcription factor [Cyanobacteria bacterium REEB67]|nr:response regulator transcription factor [Cyanobacteria bacterium REEB67]